MTQRNGFVQDMISVLRKWINRLCRAENFQVKHLKRAEAPYRFSIPDVLLPRFREKQFEQKLWSELVDAKDVLHLYYGLGPAYFLAFDGRVITDDYDFFGPGVGAYEVIDPKEAWVAVAIGADVFNLPELLRLLPERPINATDCSECQGVGWVWPTEERP